MKWILLLLSTAALAQSQEGWWMREPIRWVQTNLREVDTSLDARKLAQQLADFKANVVLFGMGGIVAHYPADLEFHQRSPQLPVGRDTFGEMLRESHARKIRVVGRFDFSKTPKYVFDAHPEWFFRQSDGAPVIYNQLYSTCINGGYYRDYAMRILSEALDRYDVDGLFFNMFGNQSSDYSGRFVGHCHCENCKQLYRQYYNKELPKQPDEQYRQFLFRASREVAAEIGKIIHAKRPHAGYFNYIQESTDGIMSESNTAIKRPLPLWPYASSDNVNRARNSQPEKMSVNLCMQFVDFPWRFVTVPQGEIRLRLWQNVAHGGALAFAINGTMEQNDRQALIAARPIFEWLASNEQYYVKQQSAAKVLLLRGPQRTGRSYSTDAYRGLFRLLSEQHIPFAVSENLDWMATRKFDLVIATDWAPKELERFVAAGGRLLVASPETPEFYAGRGFQRTENLQTYMRVRDKQKFPSLKDADLLMLNGAWTEPSGQGASAALTFVPPSMYGPPEKIHIDLRDTQRSGYFEESLGKGRVAWIPWDAGALYYRLSLDSLGNLLKDSIDNLLPVGRQVRTNAHPLVEMSLMKQGGRTLLHLINLSGHSETAYFEPLPMRGIEIQVEGKFTQARTLRMNSPVQTAADGKYTKIVLPEFRDYEVLVLE
jgi:hypothetical protein